jgi:hypothetical protein
MWLDLLSKLAIFRFDDKWCGRFECLEEKNDGPTSPRVADGV